MRDPVNLSTKSKAFAPHKPVKINGHLFMPATPNQRLSARGPLVKRAEGLR